MAKRSHSKSLDQKSSARVVAIPVISGSDIEEDIFFKIDGTVLPSQDEDGDDLLFPRQLKFKRLKTKGFMNILRGRTYSQDGHGDEEDSSAKEYKHNVSFLSEKQSKGKSTTEDEAETIKPQRQKKKRVEEEKAYATEGENETDKEDPKSVKSLKRTTSVNNRSRRRSTTPKPKQKKKETVSKKEEEDPVSTDTDGHMCDKCYVDDVLHHKNHDGNSGDDNDVSDGSLSSWDSDCAAIYAEVASKEVYDPSKILKILHTKQYQAEKYLEEQKRLETERKLEQERMLEELKKSSRGRRATVQTSKDETPKPVSYRQSSHRQNLEDKKSEKQPSTHSIKRAQSLRDQLSLQLNRLDPTIPQIVEAPSMANPPLDKYKIQKLVEEMVKQNNKIYKAEKLKAQQEKEEEASRKLEKIKMEQQKLMEVIDEQRDRYIRQLEEKQEANGDIKEGDEEQKLHEYEWWRDQRKLLDERKDDAVPFEQTKKARQQFREKHNLDGYFSECVEEANRKIRRRKSEQKRMVSQRSKKAKAFFEKSDKKMKEQEWVSIFIQPGQSEIQKPLIEHHLIPENEVEKVLKERQEKFSSKNKEDPSKYDQIQKKRAREAMSKEKRKRQIEQEAKDKKKKAVEAIDELCKQKRKNYKKKEFNTLSEMDFDFSEFRQDHQPQTLSTKNNNAHSNLQIITPKVPPPSLNQNAAQPSSSLGQIQKVQKQVSTPFTMQQNEDSKKPPIPQKSQSVTNSTTKGPSNKTYSFQKENEEEEENEISENEMGEISQVTNENQRKVNNLLTGIHETEIKIRSDTKKQSNTTSQSRNQNSKQEDKAKGGILKTTEVTLKRSKDKNEIQVVNPSKQVQVVDDEAFVLPDDFIEKIFETAEMKDLPAEYVLASERKDERNAVHNSMKKFEREIQGQLYKKNEKPISTHMKDANKQSRGGPMSAEHKAITQSNMVREQARQNNFQNQSKNPTQHLLQGEIEYVESKWNGVREVQTQYRKPTGISEEVRQQRQKEHRQVTIIQPEIPPLEMKKQLKKRVSIKEQYEQEYAQIARQEQERKDELIRKQQQFILMNDIEDNIFEMANKAAFEEYDKKRTEKKQDSLFQIDKKQQEDEGLYADINATEAYNNSLKVIVPEVFKNMSKSNFASLIKKQKNEGD